MSNLINVTVRFNGMEQGFVAEPHTYAANEKSNGQLREGWNYSGKMVLDITDPSTTGIVVVNGQSFIVSGKVSSGNNWNYNLSEKLTINGQRYQVGLNITAIKSNGVCPKGPHQYQVGLNMTPIFAKAVKGTKAKSAAKTVSQPTTTGVSDAALVELLKKLGINI
jgi:hypothetical protein